LHKEDSSQHVEIPRTVIPVLLNPWGIAGLEHTQNKPMRLGETHPEGPTIPLQKARLYKECQKGETSLLLIKL